MKIFQLGLVFLISFLCVKPIQAQQGFMNGVGANYVYFIGGNSVSGVYGIEYSPRYNFIAKDKSSVGLGSHSTLSFNYSSDFGGYYMVLVPILANLNFGAFSTEDNDQDFGGFIEAGYNIG